MNLSADPDFTLQPGAENVKVFAKRPHLLGGIQGPLQVEGGTTSADRSLRAAFVLPQEKNGPFFGIAPQASEATQIDVLNVYSDSSVEDLVGEMTSTTITGLNMSTGLNFGTQGFTADGFRRVAGRAGRHLFRHDLDRQRRQGQYRRRLQHHRGRQCPARRGQRPLHDQGHAAAGQGLVAPAWPRCTAASRPCMAAAIRCSRSRPPSAWRRPPAIRRSLAATAWPGPTTASRSARPILYDGVQSGLITALSGNVLTVAGTAIPLPNGAVHRIGVHDPKGHAANRVPNPYGADAADTDTTRVGGDTIVVTGGGGPESPLVVYGDTSQDGVWYQGDPTVASIRDFGPKPWGTQVGNGAPNFYFAQAGFFSWFGNDTIDARQNTGGTASGALKAIGINAYGGAGDDTIFGSQTGDRLAGGSGDDLIEGQRGGDLIYGDSGINVDLITRELSVVTSQGLLPAGSFDVVDHLAAGRDTLRGEGAGSLASANVADVSDVIFGDHGAITQDVAGPRFTFVAGQPNALPTIDPRLQRVQSVGRLMELVTVEPNNGAADTVFGGVGNDIVFGGGAGDDLSGDEGNDLVFGDFGQVKASPVAGGVGLDRRHAAAAEHEPGRVAHLAARPAPGASVHLRLHRYAEPLRRRLPT